MSNKKINNLMAIRIMGWSTDGDWFWKDKPGHKGKQILAHEVVAWNPYENVVQALQCVDTWLQGAKDSDPKEDLASVNIEFYCDTKEVCLFTSTHTNAGTGKGKIFSEAICDALVMAIKKKEQEALKGKHKVGDIVEIADDPLKRKGKIIEIYSLWGRDRLRIETEDGHYFKLQAENLKTVDEHG